MVSTAKNVAHIAAYTSLTAVLAQITIYLPFTPIPITLQTLAVVLSGILGSPLIGFISQITYLALIASGLPIAAGFKGGYNGSHRSYSRFPIWFSNSSTNLRNLSWK